MIVLSAARRKLKYLLGICLLLYAAISIAKQVFHQESANLVSKQLPVNAVIDISYAPSRLDIKESQLLPGVLVFRNVCIELVEKPVTRYVKSYTGRLIPFQEVQKITVYNQKWQNVEATIGLRRIYTAHSRNTRFSNWDIYFNNSSVPSTHTLRANTAFFFAECYPGNLHHFWAEEFLPLYWTIKTANQLKPDRINQLLYRMPSCLLLSENKSCSYYKTYQEMLRTLYADKFHEVFFEMTPNTCFETAVFGTSQAGLKNKKEVTNHVLTGFGLKALSLSEAKFITFINRTRRVILNLSKLLIAAEIVQLGEVKSVCLEELSVPKQAEIISQSRVLIGAQGAGLQWAMFMPPGAFMIEIAWPQNHWGFYFQREMGDYGVNTIGIEASEVFVNWKLYERRVNYGKSISKESRNKLLQHPPKTPHRNPYKDADCIVNETQLIKKLEMIKNIMSKDGTAI